MSRAEYAAATPSFRYQLVLETDEYGLLDALHELADAALPKDNSEITWTVRSDEELSP